MYFIYGSNMLLPRLKEKVPSEERVGIFTLAEHIFKFYKVNKKDGSGKCDAYGAGNSGVFVVGALFEVSDNKKRLLDQAERLGYGYPNKTVQIRDDQGGSIKAVALRE